MNSNQLLEKFRWEIYKRTGELFRSEGNKIFMPTGFIETMTAREILVGVVIMHEDSRLDYGYHRHGCININHSLRVTEEGEFSVTMSCSIIDLRSMEFGAADYIQIKEQIVANFLRSSVDVNYDKESGRIEYSIFPVGSTAGEVIHNAYEFERSVNDLLADLLPRLMETFRANLSLSSLSAPVQLNLSPFSEELYSRAIMPTGAEVSSIEVNDNFNAIVTCKYPVYHWNLQVKLEWFAALKQEILLQHYQDRVINISWDCAKRELVYQVSVKETQENLESYASDVNESINSALYKELVKRDDYIGAFIKEIEFPSPFIKIPNTLGNPLFNN